MKALCRLFSLFVLAEHLALSAFAFGPQPGQIKNLVTFGDSYTDIVSEQCENNQSKCSLTCITSSFQDGHDDGGTVWPVFAASYGNFTLFPFAKVGATCSNALTPRPFPSLFESQLPAYFAARANGSLGARGLAPHETVYTLWIGTNDVGANALLTGGQAPGVTLVDTVACAVNWVRALYDRGARNFVFQNVSRHSRRAKPDETRKAAHLTRWHNPDDPA